MTTPLWALLGFALWTLLVLASTVGLYRWTGLLTGRDNFQTFGEYRIEGADWYKRGMRAHANCVENLPVFGALVLVGAFAGVDATVLDVLALVVIGVRVPHTIVHVAFQQTNVVVGFRSLLFHTQWFAMVGMALVTAWHGWVA